MMGKLEMVRLAQVIANQTNDHQRVLNKCGENFMLDIMPMIKKEFDCKKILKRKKLMTKTENFARSYAIDMYNNKKPTTNCIAFHFLLQALDSVSEFLDVMPKIYVHLGEIGGFSAEEVKSNNTLSVEGAVKQISYKKFDTELVREFKGINTRISNFLAKIVARNDTLINPKNLLFAMNEGKKEITIEEGFKSVLEPEFEQLNDSYKSIICCSILVEDGDILGSEFNKEYKTCLTRLKNFIMKVKYKLYELSKKIDNEEYSGRIIKEFREIGEFPNLEEFKSYQEYLVREKNKRKRKNNQRRIK